jgi:MFS family permease
MTQSVAHWRTPALVVTAGCLIALLTFGVRAGFGLFLEPMSQDLGWGREVFAFAIAVQNLLWGLGQPFAGALADRYGSGRVLALGGLLYGLGVWLMAHAASPWELQLSAGVLVGLGLAGASFAIALAAMSRAVPEHKRSWVLGIGTAAGSLGQFLMVPLGQAFLGAYGWSTALVLLACGVLMVIPLAGVLQGRVDEGKSSPSAATVDQTLGEALREAGGHGGYWYLTSGFFVCGFHVAFIATHLPAYLVDNGIAPATAAWALALIGLFNVIGSYSAGILGGRYSKKYLLSSLYLTRAVAIAAFVLIPLSTLSVWMFAAAIGLLWLSTVPLASGLVAQIFGTRYMATLFGIVFLSHQAGAFLGVWLGGYLFDSTGSYGLVWWISVALGVIAAILHWPIDERRVARLAGAV